MIRPGRLLGTLRSQVQLLVGGLLVLLLVTAAATLLVQRQVTSIELHARAMLRPAQVAVAKLGEAYVDQETGARGYQLTGDEVFLQPYTFGQAMAQQLQKQLAADIVDDPISRRLLGSVVQAAATWRARSLQLKLITPQPQLSRQVRLQQELTGKNLFDTLRAQLALLDSRINVLIAAQVVRINSAQAIATVLAIAAGTVGVILVFVAALLLRSSLSRPLASLVAQVQRVADGELGHCVGVKGPEELCTVATAVETMRVRILAQTSRAIEMQRKLDLTEESERIAGGLQDLVLRRLSSTGLLLQSAASRHPASAIAFSRAVDEIDKAIRDLRGVIFGLRAGRASGGLRRRVLNLVKDSEARLGFTPQLQFDGVLSSGASGPASDELIAALGEILSVMRHDPPASQAEIRLNMADGVLRLRVTDNRQAPAGQQSAAPGPLCAVAERAARLGGTCTIGNRPGGGNAIEWTVPAGDPSGDQERPAADR